SLLALITVGSGLTGIAGAVGGLWMGLHQVPVYIGDLKLGALPLLPTAMLVSGVAVYTRRGVDADEPPLRHLAVIGAAAAGPAVVTLIATLLIEDAAATTPVSTIGLVPSMLIVAVVHAVGAAIGVASRAAHRYTEEWALPAAVPSVLRAGAVALGALLAAGAVLVVIGMVTGWSQVQEGFAAEPSVIGRIGLLLLSVLYLPNLAVGGAAVLAGTVAHVGAADYSLFATTPGRIPELPVLGVLPDEPTSPWWAIALIVPAAVAAWCALRRPTGGQAPGDRARYAVSVAAVAAAGALLLGFLAGGTVGVFDSIGVDMPMFAMAVLGWNAAAGLAVALSRGRIPLRNGLPVRMPWRRGGPAGTGDDDAADDLDGGSADTAEPDGDRAGDGPDD